MSSRHYEDVKVYHGDSPEVQEQKYLAAIEKHPEATSQFLLQLYYVYQSMGKHDKAMKCIYRVLNEATDKEHLSDAYQNIAWNYEDKGEYALAIANMEKAFEMSDSFEILLRIGRLYCQIRQYDKAEKTYQRLLTMKDEEGNSFENEYHEAMAELHNEMGDYEQLIAFKEELLEKSEKDSSKASLHRDIADLYMENDQTEQAHIHYKQAIAGYEAQLEKTGTGTEEIKLSENSSRYVNHDTDRLWLMEQIAYVYHRAGWKKQSGEWYQKTIEAVEAWLQKPDNKDGNKGYYESHLPDLYRAVDNPKQTIALFEKLLKAESRYQPISYYYRGLARAYEAEKNYKKASECWLKLLERDETSDEALLNLASIYYEQQKYDIARPYLERYIELYPKKNARAYATLAFCFDQREEPETVLSYLRQAAQVNNDMDEELAATLYCVMGKIYWHQQKNAESAVDCFRKMMERNPSEKNISDAGATILVLSFSPEGSHLAMQFWKDFPAGEKMESKGPMLTPAQIKELPYYHKKKPKDSSEKLKFTKQVVKDFEDDLLNNPAYKDFFAKYTPESVQNFIHAYARHKEGLVAHGESYMKEKAERQEGYLLTDANNAFDLILQKKLFNMQVLWRAEQLTIPQVQICYDFQKWSDAPYGEYTDCPFIDEVTKQDVELMKQFLMDNNFSERTKWWMHGWQDYEAFMERNEDDDREFMPDWYEFYDGRMGTGALLTLPDIRGKKEAYYINIYRDWKSKQPQDPPPPASPAGQPVYLRDLIPTKEQYTTFMNAFENNYLNLLHKHYLDEFEYPDQFYPKDKLWDAITELEQAKTPVYVEGGMIWYEAVIKAARQHKNSRVAEKLDEVYEDYCIKRQLLSGLSVTTAEDSAPASRDTTRNLRAEMILKGRELNGEPKDFNF